MSGDHISGQSLTKYNFRKYFEHIVMKTS